MSKINNPVFKTEQFYLPAKFLPPFGIGDKYCFPSGEIWQISGVDICDLGEDVKVTVHWCRPLHPGSEWFAEHKRGDDNWFPGAMNTRIWQRCGSSENISPDLMLVRKNRDGSFFLVLPDFVDQQESPMIFVERENMARFLAANARNQEDERAFWEALDGKVEWKGSDGQQAKISRNPQNQG